MKKSGYLPMATLMLAACGGATPGSDANAQSSGRNSRTIDVAGIRPGMTIDEAFTILKKKGFSTSVKPLRSYENALANAMAKSKGILTGVKPDRGGVNEFEATKGAEKVSSISIAPAPGRGVILNVNYTVSMAGRSRGEMLDQVLKRCGEPTVRRGDSYLAWCESGDTCLPRKNRSPMLSYDDRSSAVAVLGLNGGTAVEQDAQAQFAAEVARRGGNPASSF